MHFTDAFMIHKKKHFSTHDNIGDVENSKTQKKSSRLTQQMLQHPFDDFFLYAAIEVEKKKTHIHSGK